MIPAERYLIRIGIWNTCDLEREVEEELRRRADSPVKKDLDGLLRDIERMRNAYLEIVQAPRSIEI